LRNFTGSVFGATPLAGLCRQVKQMKRIEGASMGALEIAIRFTAATLKQIGRLFSH
jgi:hypothetical protein